MSRGAQKVQILSLDAARERRAAAEHARALVIFECAAALARQSDPALLRLIEQSFGPGFVEDRVRETLKPLVRDDAEQHVRRPRARQVQP